MAIIGKIKTTAAFECTDGTIIHNEVLAKKHQAKVNVIELARQSDFVLTYKYNANDLEDSDMQTILKMAEYIKEGYQSK